MHPKTAWFVALMQFCYYIRCQYSLQILGVCGIIQGGIFFPVSASAPPSLHKLLHVGCKLQAAHLLSQKTSLLFQVRFSFQALQFYSVSAAGLILKGLICKRVKASSHKDREISKLGKPKRPLLSARRPMVSLSVSARLLVPSASFYYSKNNHLTNRDLSLQTEGRKTNPN